MSKCELKVKGVKVTEAEHSSLYNKLEDYFQGNIVKAVNTWANTYLDSYKNIEELTVEKALVIAEIESSKGKQIPLNSLLEIKDVMRSKGITSSKVLLEQLNGIFRSKGYFEVNSDLMLDSGLYSRAEVSELMKSRELMEKTANTIRELDNSDEFTIQSEKTSEELIYKTKSKNSLGMNTLIPIEDIEDSLKEIGTQVSDISGFISLVQNQGYDMLAIKMADDNNYADYIFNKYKDFKKTEVFEINNSKIEPAKKGMSQSLLEKTMLEGVNSSKISEDIQFIREIPVDKWNEVTEEVSKLMKEIEKEAIKFNIDIIGLSTKVHSREELIDVLNNLEDVTLLLDKVSIDKPTISKFVNSYNTLVSDNVNATIFNYKQDYPENTIYLQTTATPQKMFEEYGLISLGQGYYHAVDMNVDITELAKGVDANIIEEVKNRKPILKTDEIVKLNLYTELYKYEDYIIKTPAKLSNTSEMDVEYLKTKYKDDLYNYILKEKEKGSHIYTKILKDITIDSNGINIKSISEDLLSLTIDNPLLSKLKDYASIRQDSKLKDLIKDTQITPFGQLYTEINSNMEIIKSDYIKEGEFVIVDRVANFIEIESTVFQKIDSNLYVKVGPLDSVFNMIPLNGNVEVPTNILEKSIKFNKTILDSEINIVSLTSDEVIKETEEKITCNG